MSNEAKCGATSTPSMGYGGEILATLYIIPTP